MSLNALLTQTAKVFGRATSGAPDKYGNPTTAEASGVDYRARLDMTSTGTEVLGDQDQQTLIGDLYLEPSAVVDGTDRVEVEGVSYDVVGPPERVTDRRRVRYVHARVRVVTGG